MTTASPRGSFPKRTAAMVASLATVLALSIVGTAPASAAAGRVSYSGSKPAWATPANESGTPADDTTVEGEVYLPLRNAAAAEALANAVSSPLSRSYRQFMTPQQWISRFAPTKADSNAVIAELKHEGMTITAVPASREYVVFRGTADQINAAFAVTLHTYSHAGRQLIAPSTAPSVPSALADKISAVSVDQSKFLTHPDSVQQGAIPTGKDPQSFAKARTVTTPAVKAECSQYTGQHSVTLPAAYGKKTFPTFNCGYIPSQLRSAYGLSTLAKSKINGSGQTVAIIDAYASPSIVSDVNTYSAAEGEPGFKTGQYRQIVPKLSDFKDTALCQEPSGWQTEETIDVEAVHGLATGANVLYVGGYNCGGGLDIAMSTILDKGLANIVNNSYSDATEDLPSDVIAGENNLYLQATAEGIGLYFSSGDDGDLTDLGESPQPAFPASDPWVTSVGGTSVGIDKSGKIAYETGWGDLLDKVAVASDGSLSYTEPVPGTLFGGGAGGGRSTVFSEPSYQKGVVPNSLARGMRVNPDIAALADPYTGFMIGIRPITKDSTLQTGPYENQTWGGTSLASPLVAAQMAIVQQATHSHIGFANPTLYGLDRIAPHSYRDVVPANPPVALAYTGAVSGTTYLITLDRDSSLKTARGYDDVTGLGSLTYGLLTLLAAGRH